MSDQMLLLLYNSVAVLLLKIKQNNTTNNINQQNIQHDQSNCISTSCYHTLFTHKYPMFTIMTKMMTLTAKIFYEIDYPVKITPKICRPTAFVSSFV